MYIIYTENSTTYSNFLSNKLAVLFQVEKIM